MAFNERHTEILRILRRKGVSVRNLTERLGVSEVTVRRDLSLLEPQGRFSRTRGQFSSQDPIEAQLRASAIECSRRCVVLADHARYAVSALGVVATADSIDAAVMPVSGAPGLSKPSRSRS